MLVGDSQEPGFSRMPYPLVIDVIVTKDIITVSCNRIDDHLSFVNYFTVYSQIRCIEWFVLECVKDGDNSIHDNIPQCFKLSADFVISLKDHFINSGVQEIYLII